ncbi:MAG: hemolysin family protein [Actinomycetota bacterium]
MAIALGIAALVALVAIAAYLAASETALMRVSRIRVRFLSDKKVRRADRLEKLIEDPDRFLPGLLLLTLLVQLSSASLATWVTTRLTGSAGLGVIVGTGVITVFMFLFGELVPKAWASHESEKVALGVSGSMTLLSRVLRPLAMVFQYTARGILGLFSREALRGEIIVRDEGEIKAMVTAAEEHDVIEEEEKDMIHSVFEFGDTMVREVMVPRPDMITLPSDATVKDALALTIEHGYSRIPVYEGELDNIRGVLYAKDLMQHLQQSRLDVPVRGLVRDAFIVPETKVLSDLLKELQRRKVHIAIVVDEYGTVAGLATIEDLLEEIVGEIFDEFDREVSLVDKLASGMYRVDARLTISDLNEILQIELPEEEGVDTVGGLVLKALGHLPDPGESLDLGGIHMVVEKLRNNRISKVMMELPPEEQPPNR